jgi:hypothetical protein
LAPGAVDKDADLRDLLEILDPRLATIFAAS